MMSQAHKILLGIYLATVFIAAVILAILLLPLPLGLFKFFASLLACPIILGLLFAPFFLIWNDESNLSDRGKIIISAAYSVLWITAAAIFVYSFINTPKALLKPVFTSKIVTDKIVVSNPSPDPFFSCTFLISSKGKRQAYQSFFHPFTLQNCNRQGTSKSFLECQIDNRLALSRSFPKATRLDKIDPDSDTSLDLNQFYVGQTLPARQFLSGHTPLDIYSLTIICQQSNGTKVSQTIISP